MCRVPHHLPFQIRVQLGVVSLEHWVKCKDRALEYAGVFNGDCLHLQVFSYRYFYLDFMIFGVYFYFQTFMSCKRFNWEFLTLELSYILRLVTFIDLCKINKLAMSLNSYFMDLGCDTLYIFDAKFFPLSIFIIIVIFNSNQAIRKFQLCTLICRERKVIISFSNIQNKKVSSIVRLTSTSYCIQQRRQGSNSQVQTIELSPKKKKKLHVHVHYILT